MVSSITYGSKASEYHHGKREEHNGRSRPYENGGDDNGELVSIYMTIYLFRGYPYDVFSARHMLMYFTSPNLPDFFETVHIQRETELDDWAVDRMHIKVDWLITPSYISHVNAGRVDLPKGQENLLAEIMATVPTVGRGPGWNCQNFIFEGLREIVNHGLETEEWYSAVEDELTDRMLDGAVN